VADVVIANSGEEALRQLLKGEFAVILLDVYMPGMDGYETAHIIRSREQTKRIPIVFLSAVNKEAEHLIRGYSMGAVDYVFKPVEPLVLRSKVAVFVDLFTMTKEIQRKARRSRPCSTRTSSANAEQLSCRAAAFARRAAPGGAHRVAADHPLSGALESIARPRYSAATSAAYRLRFDDSGHADLWAERLHPDDREQGPAALPRRPRDACALGDIAGSAPTAVQAFPDQAVLLRDAARQPVEYAGTLLDVTDRKDSRASSSKRARWTRSAS
jgi:CheY-like chemotaxis protein